MLGLLKQITPSLNMTHLKQHPRSSRNVVRGTRSVVSTLVYDPKRNTIFASYPADVPGNVSPAPFVFGRSRSGESLIDCLRRCVREERGLDIDKRFIRPLLTSLDPRFGGSAHLYVAFVSEGSLIGQGANLLANGYRVVRLSLAEAFANAAPPPTRSELVKIAAALDSLYRDCLAA